MVCSVVLALMGAGVTHPVFPPNGASSDVPALIARVSEAMARTPDELYALTPSASGIYFVGCPNCHGGAQENGVFDYALEMGDTVRCRYCGMVFPNAAFPNNRELAIVAPSGARQVYRWHEDDAGHQYFFEAHAWWHRWQWTQEQAYRLANLYALTCDAQYGDRAAAIIGRFAQVYPDYPVRFDYPYKPKRFFPADQRFPYDDIESFRGAKFYWWGYADIPEKLALAYDLIAPGDAFERMERLLGKDIRQRIENDLIRLGYEFTAANPDPYGNMSPGMYRAMIVAGRVIGAPEMVHEAVDRFRTLTSRNFFADGWWYEAAPSYHWQTVGNLERVVDAARGYSDPPEAPEPRFEHLDLAVEVPLLAKAERVHFEAVLPDGRLIPVNDTWATDKAKALEASVSRLWPAMGHAVLAAGTGETQFQAHLNWSGGFSGHAHPDNASIILWAFGKEMVSDVGYTHTRYRNWVFNTASHNTVVIDARSQAAGSKLESSAGNLLFYDDHDPHVRFIDVDASPAYPGCSQYRRRLLHVHAAEGKDYVVDLFDVAGGQTHDWFLHGSADEEGTFVSSVALDTEVESLVPAWGGQQPYESELDMDASGETRHAYAFLKDISSAVAHGPCSVQWTYGSVGLNVNVFPEDGATLLRFTGPAIRGAKEVDANLEVHRRHGFLVRHEGGQSRFAAVYAPFRGEPWIQTAEFSDGTFRVRYDGIEDMIVFGEDCVTVTSSAGWRYETGTPVGSERGAG